MARKTRPTSTSTRKPPRRKAGDPATQYAYDVVDGHIVAGPLVRAACRRHLGDIDRQNETGLRWDVGEVERVVGYFRDVLTVEVEEPDPDTGITESKVVPFILQPWQCFIVGSIFGWKKPGGLRRFRRAYVEIAKGNGKSPLAAGIGHYMLTATKKIRAEVYSAATDRDQAAILFRDAVSMWKRSPRLFKQLHPKGDTFVWELVQLQTESFFKPISSEKKGKSGIRPYCALVDEVHEHPNLDVIELLRAGTKGNQQALIFEITNSGFDRNSVCWHEHEYTREVVEGIKVNDSWFGFVACLDKDEDPFKNEDCWIKANPNLGVSIQFDFIREQVQEARGMPSKESLVRRLHFCEWVGSGKTWVTQQIWERTEARFKLADYKGLPCYMGLDMSFTQDLTALSYVFSTGENSYDAFLDYWTPLETMLDRAKRDGVDYPLWVKDGWIIGTEGKVIKLDSVAERIQWALEFFDVQSLAYDAYRHKELDIELAELDCHPPLIEHPQGFRRGKQIPDPLNFGKNMDNPLWMPSSFDLTETAIIENRLRVQLSPVTRWNVSCVVVRNDPAGTGNRVFDKVKATGRIDGVVALAMGIGACAIKKRPQPKSVYELMSEGATEGADLKEEVPGSVAKIKRPIGEDGIDYEILNNPRHPDFFKVREAWERIHLSDD